MSLASRLTVIPATTVTWPITLTVASRGLIHGDPDHQGRSNVKPFRRVGQHVSISHPGKAVESYQLAALLTAAPYPRSIAPYLENLSAPQYFAVALVARFLNHYNGHGLLDGMERYTRLADHLGQSASRTENLPAWWSDLADAVQVGGRGADDRDLLLLLGMPHALAGHVRTTLQDETETTIVFARAWHDEEKLMDAGYAEKAGKTHNRGGHAEAAFLVSDLPAPTPTVIRTVPHFSSNALRHEVRDAAQHHLKHRVGIADWTIPSLSQLMQNGGGIESGATIPADEVALGLAVQQAYPSLALLGGATGQFLLPASYMSIPNWLVCTENRAILARYGITPYHPAEAQIAVMTHVRGGDDKMPHAAEVLVQGSQILAEYALAYGAPVLCAGALAAALTWWHDHAPTLGGVAAQGFGHITFDLPTDPAFVEARDAYEAYLADNQERLRAGLLDGMLTTGKVICGALKVKKAKGTGKATADTSGGLFDVAES